MTFAFDQIDARLQEKARERIHFQVKQRALVNIAKSVEFDLPSGNCFVRQAVVFNFVCFDDGASSAQLRIAFNLRVNVWLPSDAVAKHKRGRVVQHLRRYGFLQAR